MPNKYGSWWTMAWWWTPPNMASRGAIRRCTGVSWSPCGTGRRGWHSGWWMRQQTRCKLSWNLGRPISTSVNLTISTCLPRYPGSDCLETVLWGVLVMACAVELLEGQMSRFCVLPAIINVEDWKEDSARSASVENTAIVCSSGWCLSISSLSLSFNVAGKLCADETAMLSDGTGAGAKSERDCSRSLLLTSSVVRNCLVQSWFLVSDSCLACVDLATAEFMVRAIVK